MKFAIRIFLLIALLIWPALASADPKLPKFSGVYVIQKGEWVEISPIEKSETKKLVYNKHRVAKYGWMVANIAYTTTSDKFAPTEEKIFNRDGFLVIFSPENKGMPFSLCRVPSKIMNSTNEDRPDIALTIEAHRMIGGDFSEFNPAPDDNLERSNEKDISLKTKRVGEDAYAYIPSQPIEKGLYYIKGWKPYLIAVK